MTKTYLENAKRWQFGLSTLFAITLTVAAFCSGWLVNERRHQDTAIPAGGGKPRQQTQRVLALLNQELTTRESKIRNIEAGINRMRDTADSDAEVEFASTELKREQRVADLIKKRAVDIQATLATSTIPAWMFKQSLATAVVTGSFLVGRTSGAELERFVY